MTSSIKAAEVAEKYLHTADIHSFDQGSPLYDQSAVYNAFLAGYAAAHQWIEVTPETMPEGSGHFLVYYTIPAKDEIYEYQEVYWYSMGKWSINGEECSDPLFWQPLPPPPKQSNEKI